MEKEKFVIWWGRFFWVPKYIYRYDTSSAHGWQVRRKNRHKEVSKFFSDRGDPENALERAKAYLKKYGGSRSMK
jgi:hypothetical protein